MRADSFRNIMRNYASDVTLRRGRTGETVQTRAFLQRIRGRRANVPLLAKNIGAVDTRYWIYLGPAEHTLRTGDAVLFHGREYEVQDSERIDLGGEPTHVWALLRTMPEVYP